ncbi:28S ribosomal protein S6, mitochondrial [Desmophyllum pertusum]|uniref:Small ribosomal subunit protein bS6m n=1 Tax=Desmophyllum pertusum TaxID=174260 RepID=A0A9W9Y895_9CNID|nr:28S ribosomal protein S6, mitochondrial [Desmophyllum pertusum]
MPEYELAMITKLLAKEGFASVLRRTAQFIMDKGGVVKKMENLGEQELPYRMRSHHQWNSRGRYFLINFILGADGLKELKHELKTDIDLIRPRVVRVRSCFEPEKKRINTLECWNSYKPPKS